MKLIHCADIHLDSRLETHFDPQKAAERREELTGTFVSLLRRAGAEKIPGVLISGDLFDTARVTSRTEDMVLSAISSVPDTTVFYLPGNHDEASVFHETALPENLRVFSEEWKSWPLGDVIVSGAVLNGRNNDRLYASVPTFSGKKHVVLLHGQIGGTAGPDRIPLNAFQDRGITYLALGHLHSFSRGILPDGTVWCYPGCLEGRGFDECGQKGFVTVDLSGSAAKTEFIPFAGRTLHRVTVDVTGLTRNSEAAERGEAQLSAFASRDLVELVLTGVREPSWELSLSYLARWWKDRFYFFRIRDDTVLRMPREDYTREVSLRGGFVRKVMRDESLSGEDKAAVIQFGLMALRNEELEL